MPLGLCVLNGPLYVLRAGQQGLDLWDNSRGCYSAYTTGLAKAKHCPCPLELQCQVAGLRFPIDPS